MHPTHTLPGSRVGYLDSLGVRGTHVAFYDPDGDRYGLPTYPYHWAPGGLYTIRQLRARGLRPGGQQPVAQIMWRRRKRIVVGFLYRADLAKPKRRATPAQLIAIGRALAARRTCPICGREKPYYIPRSLGECLDCADGGHR